jgi:hypothetical protein
MSTCCAARAGRDEGGWSARRSQEARAALQWLLDGAAADDFKDCSVVERSAWYATDYLGV